MSTQVFAQRIPVWACGRVGVWVWVWVWVCSWMQARVRDPTYVCPATAMAKRNASASLLQREVTEVVRGLARGPLVEEFVEPSTGYSIDIWLPSLQVACVRACVRACMHVCMHVYLCIYISMQVCIYWFAVFRRLLSRWTGPVSIQSCIYWS